MNDEKFLLSICIPTYNGGDHLVENVRNILNAGYSNVEVVVSDNCSEDDSVSKLREITDKRLKVYANQKNEGPLKNWYLALSRGTGKYIMLLQDNDEVVIENLGAYISLLENFKNIVVLKNGIIMNRLSDNPVSASKFLYYSVILNHVSYSLYLRSAFIALEFDDDALNIMKTCYPMEYWDIQILSQRGAGEKIGWINEDLPIVRTPERKVASRTGKVGSSCGYVSYTYEWNVYYAKEWIMNLRRYMLNNEQFIKGALNGFYGKLIMATYRYYDNMHIQSARDRYDIPFIKYSNKEWLDLNWDFYKVFLTELQKTTKLSKNEIFTMKLIALLNRCRFNEDYFMEKKKTNLKYRFNHFLIRILCQQVERRLEYGIR